MIQVHFHGALSLFHDGLKEHKMVNPHGFRVFLDSFKGCDNTFLCLIRQVVATDVDALHRCTAWNVACVKAENKWDH